jgi:hypothetical protein
VLLDHDDTLHLTALGGVGLGSGQPPGSLRISTRLGLGIGPDPLPAVPEPVAPRLWRAAGLRALMQRVQTILDDVLGCGYCVVNTH